MVEMLSDQLRVDQAILTGESCSVGKEVANSVATNAVYQDKTNVLFLGTIIVVGRARSVVVGIGANTATGSIRDAMLQTGDETTPLKKKLDEFGSFLAKVTPLSWAEWTVVLYLSFPVIIIDEVLKFFSRSSVAEGLISG